MKKRLPYLALLSIVTMPSMRGSPPGQQKPRPNSLADTAKKPSKHSGLPVLGGFEATQTETPEDQQRRYRREDHYSLSHLPRPVSDPGLLVDGQAETISLRFVDYAVVGKPVDPHGIPVSISNAVIVGTVVDGKAFVSHNRDFVYTDYRVRVDKILQPDPTTNLSVGTDLIAARPGGAVRFPSGHVTNYLVQGQGLPEIGSQYVLFLSKSIPDIPEYEIISGAAAAGFQLKNGRAYPLDDVNAEYEGVDAASLLDQIQKAITSAGGTP